MLAVALPPLSAKTTEGFTPLGQRSATGGSLWTFVDEDSKILIAFLHRIHLHSFLVSFKLERHSGLCFGEVANAKELPPLPLRKAPNPNSDGNQKVSPFTK